MKSKNLFFVLFLALLFTAGCTENTTNKANDSDNHTEHNENHDAHPHTDEGADTRTTADDSVKIETGLTAPEDAAEKEAQE